MIRICPSVLNADQAHLSDEISRVDGVADFIHLDIMDGRFVPNFTYDESQTREIVTSSVLPIDLHLMVEDCDHWGPRYAQMRDAGVFSVTVHYEATNDVESTLSKVRAEGVRSGLALKPSTSAEVIINHLHLIDMVLVMTVEPGFGGQSFMQEMMPKVRQVRELLRRSGRPTTWLQVDGGISITTIEEAVSAGADTFVAGSAVYKSSDPRLTVNELRMRAESSLK